MNESLQINNEARGIDPVGQVSYLPGAFARISSSSSRCPLTPQRCPFGGACHTCPTRVQPKLSISQQGDEQEQEADRVAEMVMRMPDAGKKEEKEHCEANSMLVVQRNLSDSMSLTNVPPIVHKVLSSQGEALDTGTRSFMEQRFGFDFSQVKVHSDQEAVASARAINAQAYTTGNDIVFGDRLKTRSSTDGLRLLAHELTHVVQQQESSPLRKTSLPVSDQITSDMNDTPVAVRRLSTHNSECQDSTIYRKIKGDEASTTVCGGPRTCASGTACSIADNAIIGPMPPSSWWKLTVMIDVEAPTASDVTESTPGHAYVKFTESNGNIFTYGFYPDPARPPNILRTRTIGCVVHPDTIHEGCVDYKEEFILTQQEYEQALTSAQSFCKAAPGYDLQAFNCTTFVSVIVQLASKSLPPIRGNVGSGMFSLSADNPNTLLEGLRARDAARRRGSAPP